MKETTIERVAVLGAGTMGSGIAQVAAMAGYTVRVRDVDEAVLARAQTAIGASLDRIVAKGKLTADERAKALAAVTFTTSFDHAVGDADAIVEAVPERMELKRETFQAL